MGTDGSVERCRCELTTTYPALRDGFAELLASLALRYDVKEREAKLNGRLIGKKWCFRFSVRDTVPVFRLTRKLSRMKAGSVQRDKWRSRHVASIERAPVVPTRCITVDAPDGLFLVGRRFMQTHNSPFGATLCLAHMRGPVVFDGRDANGEPVGRPHPTPWVQVVAVSEEQTDNTWLALYEMVVNQKGGFADIPGLDACMSAIFFPGGGKVEPRTASGRSRLGARLFFALFDEPHLMVESNGGLLLATARKRNLAGMGGRWDETSNSYDPSEGSIAQRTAESPAKDVYIDSREPDHRPDLTDDADSLAMLAQVYGDSWWVDTNRILADARDP